MSAGIDVDEQGVVALRDPNPCPVFVPRYCLDWPRPVVTPSCGSPGVGDALFSSLHPVAAVSGEMPRHA
jgi:hypothetical protein